MKKLIALMCVALAGCGSVDAGEVGLWNKYGNISDKVAGPGLHFYMPIGTDLETFNIKSQKVTGETSAYTQDLQTADVNYALTYSLSPQAVVRIRKTVGSDYANVLIPPIMEGTIKNVFAKFTAMNAVAQRPVIQSQIQQIVRQRLRQRGITVESFELTNIGYSDAFEAAVERAQVATQNAVAARNQTAVVKEQAVQAIARAEGEARAIQLRSQALEANPRLVEYEAVQKWNGVLPQNMYGGGAMPFVNVGNK